MLQTLELELQKGVILFNPKTRLDDGSIRPKFFILMENPTRGSKSLIIFMTTSQRTSPKKGIMIEEPFLAIRNKAYLIFRKYLNVPIGVLNNNYQIKGILSKTEIERIDKMLSSCDGLNLKVKKIILRPKEVLPEKTFIRSVGGIYDKKTADLIKKKLGLKK